MQHDLRKGSVDGGGNKVLLAVKLPTSIWKLLLLGSAIECSSLPVVYAGLSSTSCWGMLLPRSSQKWPLVKSDLTLQKAIYIYIYIYNGIVAREQGACMLGLRFPSSTGPWSAFATSQTVAASGPRRI